MSIKRFMMFAFCAFIAVTLISGCSSSAAKKDVKYVFVLIGDGFGPNQRIVGEQASGKTLAMNTLPCSVPTGTNNVNGDVTDSAASGTAIACGVKTYNGAIGVDANKGKLTSLAKNLKEKGMSIGIISSCAITDATPAAQYAQ